jgi:MYXO-CTERM domain-containing protein
MKTAVLAAGLSAGPLAWFFSLAANFALSPLACATAGKSPLGIISLAALLLALLGGIVVWRRRAERQYMAVGGAIVSAFCGLVIVAQAIPTMMLGGCE